MHPRTSNPPPRPGILGIVVGAAVLAVAPSTAIAQEPPAAPAAILDVAAADRAFAAAPKLPKGVPPFSFVRTSSDGTHRVWVNGQSGRPSDPTQEDKPDRIDVVVEDTATNARRTTSFEVADHWQRFARGPAWIGNDLAIGYEVHGKETVIDACVDLVHDGEAKALLREPDTYLRSVATSVSGLVVAATCHRLHPESSVVVFDRDGATKATIDTGSKSCLTAAASPDGRWIAMVHARELAVVPAAGGEPRTVATIARPDNDTTGEPDVPNWLADGKSFVVAADGEVVHADCANGEVRRWSQKQLGGVAVAAFALPGDHFAAAIVIETTEAGPVDIFLGAGEASHAYVGRVVWLDLRSGAATRAAASPQRLGRTATAWRAMPGLGAFAATLQH